METAQKDATLRTSRKKLAVSFVAVAMVAVVAAIVAVSYGAAAARRAGTPASGYGSSTPPYATITLKCGTSTTPNCPTAPPDPNQDWIPIPADTPANVLAAFLHSSLYQAVEDSNATGVGDAQYDLSRPDTPVFIRELHAPGGMIFPDMWVIPFDMPDGMIGIIVTCDINPSHTDIQVDGVGGIGTPRPHDQLPFFTRSEAVSRVEAQSHVALRPGAEPYLVFTPIDSMLIETGKAVWNGGGGPGAPLWLVPGADGKDRVLGDDGKVYFPAQIPVVKAN